MIPPVLDDPNPGVPAEYRRTVNHSSVAYGRWLKAKLAEMPVEAADAVAFQTLVAPYGATRVYEARNLAHLQLRLLVDGKEDLTKVTNSMAAGPTAEPTAQDKVMQTALGNGSFTVVDDQLVQNYLVAPNAAQNYVFADGVHPSGASPRPGQREGGEQEQSGLGAPQPLTGAAHLTVRDGHRGSRRPNEHREVFRGQPPRL